MDPTPWKKFRANNEVVVLGHFKNVYGERYVIYRMKNGDVMYFTGDEVDWETRLRLIGANFTFNADERAKIAKILWPVMEDGAEVARAHETGESLDVWRPWDGTPEPEIIGD